MRKERKSSLIKEKHLKFPGGNGVQGSWRLENVGPKARLADHVLREGPKEHGFKEELSVIELFGPHRVVVREISELLSDYYLCDKATSPSFSQNSPSLPQIQ